MPELVKFVVEAFIAIRFVVETFVATMFVAVAFVNVPPVEEMRPRPVMF